MVRIATFVLLVSLLVAAAAEARGISAYVIKFEGSTRVVSHDDSVSTPRLDGNYVWVRMDGREYFFRNEGLVHDVRELWRPAQRAGQEKREAERTVREQERRQRELERRIDRIDRELSRERDAADIARLEADRREAERERDRVRDDIREAERAVDRVADRERELKREADRKFEQLIESAVRQGLAESR